MPDPTPTPDTLRAAAQAVVDAWGRTGGTGFMTSRMDALRAALAAPHALPTPTGTLREVLLNFRITTTGEDAGPALERVEHYLSTPEGAEARAALAASPAPTDAPDEPCGLLAVHEPHPWEHIRPALGARRCSGRPADETGRPAAVTAPREAEQIAARQELADAQHRKDRALLVALIRHAGGRVTLSTDEVAFADPAAIITATPTDLGDFVTVDVASWVKP